MNWTKTFFYLLFVAVIVSALFFYRWIFPYLIASIIFSYILDPYVSKMERIGIPRWTAVISLYIVVIGLLAWITSRFIPDLMAQGNSLFVLLSHNQDSVGDTILHIPFVKGMFEYAADLDSKIPGLNLSVKFSELLDSGMGFMVKLPKLLVNNYQSILGALSFVGTVPLISFFLLKDKHKMRKSLLRFSSNRYFELCVILLGKIDKTVGTYLRAMLFEVMAVGIMASVALSIVGVSNPVLIGISAGVANIIPYFGPFFGASLAVLTVLFDGSPLSTIIYAGLAMYIVQVIDNNIIYPVVVGTTIDMHPLWVLLTVLAGGWYGGILWMLISVPLVYLVYTLINVLYTNLKEYRII